MPAFLTALALIAFQQKTPPTFKNQTVPTVEIRATTPAPPRLDPPSNYKSLRVPDYVATTYMQFARDETAHDFRLSGVESRVGVLEQYREKTDRPDIESLKDTRTKAVIYLSIGSTLFVLVWGALAALAGFFFKAYIAPRLRTFWCLLRKKQDFSGAPDFAGIALNAEGERPPKPKGS